MENRVVPLGLSPPFGYKKVENGKRICFEEDLIQSNIVRKIFTWYVYGNGDGKPMSLSSIAKSLTEEGNNPTSGDIHSKRSKKRGYGGWSRSTVGQILLNETYIGVWHYGKHKSVIGSDGKKRKVLRSKEEWVPVEVPPIIDINVWNLAQNRRAKLAAKRNYKRHNYLLSGFVRCAKCNSPVHSTKTGNTRHRYYRCASRSYDIVSVKCDLDVYFRADWTERAIWHKLTALFNDDEQLSAGLEAYRMQTKDSLQEIRDAVGLIQSTSVELKNELEGLYQDFKEARGTKHRARINLDIDRVENQLSNLEKQQGQLEAKIAAADLTENDIITLKRYAAQTRNDWATISRDFESKRLLFERLDLQIRLDKNDAGQRIARIKIRLAPEECVVIDARTTRS